MYSEDCCWNFIQERCIGQKCACECHMPISHLGTSESLVLEAQRDLYELYKTSDVSVSLMIIEGILKKILRAQLIDKRI